MAELTISDKDVHAAILISQTHVPLCDCFACVIHHAVEDKAGRFARDINDNDNNDDNNDDTTSDTASSTVTGQFNHDYYSGTTYVGSTTYDSDGE